MADAHAPSSPLLPPPQQRSRTGSMSLGNTATATSENGPPPANGTGAGQNPPDAKPEGNKQVQDVLTSEIAVPAMLNRLKQSIASAKEFAHFLKRRSMLEEEHAQGLRKLCRMSQENIRRADHRGGTFVLAFDEMMFVHDRMAENGMQFALSLHQMHEDLLELASIAERNRKGWKTNGLAAEQRVAEIEAAMKKSKNKYDSLAEEYERARTGDTRQSGKMFGFKGARSAAQHEEDLLRKVQGADQDYHGRVQTLQAERGELVSRTRPEAVKALHDLVKETDSGLTLQMQKFASFNEKLLLSNGLSISPIKGQGPDSQHRSLREAVASIDNERDLNEYLAAHHSRLPPNYGEPKYERHPVLNPQPPALGQQANPMQQQYMGGGPMSPPGQFPVQPLGGQPPHGQMQPPGSRQGSNYTSPTGSPGVGPPLAQAFPPSMSGAQPPRPSSQQHHQQQHQQQHGRNFSTGAMLTQQSTQPPQQGATNRHSAGQPRIGNTMSSQGPPQLGALSFQTAATPPTQQPPAQFSPPQQMQSGPAFNPLQQNPTSTQPMGGPPLLASAPLRSQYSPPPQPPMAPAQAPKPAPSASKPVFGLTLAKLYERDGLAVPMVVYQCIQAVDLFGLGLEGIYRQSGSMNHIGKLKVMFDTDSGSPVLDFRNPENFYHDVNSVTGLLKQFFRDLPDPLLTKEHHMGFIEAAKHEDDVLRRDSLHAIINSLPDPNYATLRALTLHLYRVMENSHMNRMNSHNLAVIFGPTLMGTGDAQLNIADAGWQIKVIDTILQNTYQIFDDD